jgi:hypothetical protein
MPVWRGSPVVGKNKYSCKIQSPEFIAGEINNKKEKKKEEEEIRGKKKRPHNIISRQAVLEPTSNEKKRKTINTLIRNLEIHVIIDSF